VRAVLPGMVERGDGAILFTAGQPGIHPNLNTVLADKGVYVGAVKVGALIEGGVPHQAISSAPGPLEVEPEVIHPDVFAERFWELYSTRGSPEALVGSFGL
jgi:hypothetical protein